MAFAAIIANPGCLKIIAVGSLVINGWVGTTLVLPAAAAQVWGESMAELQSVIEGTRALMTILLTPAFGRLCDKLPRKWALLLLTLLSCAGTWPFLLLGESSASLWMVSCLRMLEGAANPTACIFAMLKDHSTAEQRSSMYATGQSVITLFGLVVQILSASVSQAFPGTMRAPCWVDVACLAGAVAVIVSIRDAPSEGDSQPPAAKVDVADAPKAGDQHPIDGISDISTDVDTDEDSINTSAMTHLDDDASFSEFALKSRPASFDVGRSKLSRRLSVISLAGTPHTQDIEAAAGARVVAEVEKQDKAAPKTRCRCNFLSVFNFADTVRLVASTPCMPSIVAIAVLCNLPKVLKVCVTPQFTFQAFGAMGDAHRIARMMIAFTMSETASLAIFLSLAGAISGCIGLVPFIRCLVPLIAVMQLMPLVFLAVHSLGVVAAVSALSCMNKVIDFPLCAVVSVVVPAHRTIEALSAMTAIKALTPLIGNVFSGVAAHFLGAQLLWVMYPVVAAIVLLAWPFAFRLQPPAEASRDEPEAMATPP